MDFAALWNAKARAIQDVDGTYIFNPASRDPYSSGLAISAFSAGTSETFVSDIRSGIMPYNPTTQPRKHIAKCTHCGVSSMIPDKTDKIMALLCPQCGSPLDA